jgi:hypothetical protein
MVGNLDIAEPAKEASQIGFNKANSFQVYEKTGTEGRGAMKTGAAEARPLTSPMATTAS